MASCGQGRVENIRNVSVALCEASDFAHISYERIDIVLLIKHLDCLEGVRIQKVH